MLYDIANYPFTNPAGSGTTAVELGPFDLSRAIMIRLVLILNSVGTADAGDTLDIYFQEAIGVTNTIWSDRAHFDQITGAMVVSAAAPELRTIQWPCVGAFETVTDESYEPSGSAGGTRLAAGAFITGPLLGKRRGSAGSVSRHRLTFEQVDANSNAGFSGVVAVMIDSPGGD